MTSNAASSVADGGLVAVAGSSARPVEGSAAGCVATVDPWLDSWQEADGCSSCQYC